MSEKRISLASQKKKKARYELCSLWRKNVTHQLSFNLEVRLWTVDLALNNFFIWMDYILYDRMLNYEFERIWMACFNTLFLDLSAGS